MKKWLKQLFCRHDWKKTDSKLMIGITAGLVNIPIYTCSKCGKKWTPAGY
jgi:hypothetical protein